jgi:predicted  nucleic acid-binding Zn-ribbon protein
MNWNKDKNEGRIFPGLRDSTREPEESAEHRSREERSVVSPRDWDEAPTRAGAYEGPRATLRPKEVRKRGQGNGGLWLAFTFLLALLAGAAYFGNQTLRDANINLSKVPDMLKSLATVDTRLSDLESQLSAWSRNWQDLSGRLNKVEKNARAEYAGARKHAEVLTAQLRTQVGQLRQQIADRDQAVDARLGQLDASQKSAQERIAQLKQQLSDAQRELASLRQETNGDLTTLHQRVAGNDQQLGQLTSEVERRRVDFELSRNQITNLSSEVTMDLTATDVHYQRYSGWVYFEPDRRYLWIRQQGVAQPVLFYDAQKSRQYEVIVTSLREGSAVGFLLVPQGSSVVQPEPYAGAPAGK